MMASLSRSRQDKGQSYPNQRFPNPELYGVVAITRTTHPLKTDEASRSMEERSALSVAGPEALNRNFPHTGLVPNWVLDKPGYTVVVHLMDQL